MDFPKELNLIAHHLGDMFHADLITVGLVSDMAGAVVLVLPDVFLRAYINPLYPLGRLEIARQKLFEGKENLENNDTGFEEFKTYLTKEFDEQDLTTSRTGLEHIDYFDINGNRGNLRVHLGPNDRVKIRTSDSINRAIDSRYRKQFHRLGIGLLVVGFGLQIFVRSFT